MLKQILTIAFFLSVYASNAQSTTDTTLVVNTTDTTLVADSTQPPTEVIDTVQMDLVYCLIGDTLGKCKRVQGYGLMKKEETPLSCSNTTGYETIDMQIYLDDKKVVFDRSKYDIFYK